MKNLQTKAIALVALGTVMLLTNPSKADYTDYAYNTLKTQIQGAICQRPQLPESLRGAAAVAGNFCKNVIATGVVVTRGDIKNIIENTTSRQNLLVLSLYTTDISGYTVRSVGAFGNFLTYQK
ncbi:MAG: DUF4359 domain-containing protein [Heteroscytonema crispum UTEX LB 1556]